MKRHQKVLRLSQKIREALLDYSQESWEKDKGIYETDEALYGGEWANLKKYVEKRLREEGKAKRGRGAKARKKPVFGIYKRDEERVYLELIDDFSPDTLELIIEEVVEEQSGESPRQVHKRLYQPVNPSSKITGKGAQKTPIKPDNKAVSTAVNREVLAPKTTLLKISQPY